MSITDAVPLLDILIRAENDWHIFDAARLVSEGPTTHPIPCQAIGLDTIRRRIFVGRKPGLSMCRDRIGRLACAFSPHDRMITSTRARWAGLVSCRAFGPQECHRIFRHIVSIPSIHRNRIRRSNNKTPRFVSRSFLRRIPQPTGLHVETIEFHH